ncbi:hypothetical protein ACFLWR_00600 [Chloroflexota bacterium]
MVKKKMSTGEYIETLLELRSRYTHQLVSSFENEFNYAGDPKLLNYEIMIFSLWLLILSLPPSMYGLRDRIHDRFCEILHLDGENKTLFFNEVDVRYSNYFEAYNMWQKNPTGGHTLGGVIVETIINHNPDFSLKTHLPLVGAIEAMKAFIVFNETFKSNIKTIGALGKKIKLVD